MMPPIPDKRQLSRFVQQIENQLGLVFAETKYGRLQRHLMTRMKELECERFSEYFDILIDKRRHAGEIAWWVEVLTVGETYFYRNQPHWDALQDHIIPELLQRHQKDRELRFWSSGCATGEEPYTLAMILNEAIPDISSWQIDILATDLNPKFIKVAKIAKYGKRSVRALSSELLRKYFDKSENQYIARHRLKKMVSFMIHNLVSDWRRNFRWQHGYFDVIICRNVIMYFRRERAKQVISSLAESMRENGYLFLGHSESSLGTDLGFVTEQIGNAFLYRKSSGENQEKSGSFPFTSMNEVHLPQFKPSTEIPHDPPSLSAPKFESSSIVPTHRNEQDISSLPEVISSSDVSRSMSGEEEILLQGKKLLQEDNFDQAEQLLTAATEEHPLSGNIQLLYGIAAKTRGKTDQAISAFRRTLYLDSTNMLARFYLASLWQEKGTFDRAVVQYQMLLQQTKGHDPATVIGSTEGLTIGLLRAACENALQQS